MNDQLIHYLGHYTHLSAEEIAALNAHGELRQFEKNAQIFSHGRVADELYFVVQGCARLYYMVDGVDKTAFFYTEGQFICAGESYTFGVLAKENYQAVEPTTLFVLTKVAIEKLLQYSSKFEVIARVATENELLACQQMIASFVTLSPEQRYLELLENHGELFQRVPQQYIASYLGVSPETLSRIKKRVVEKMRS